MSKQANKRRREVEFQVGERVYLKIRPYRQKSLAKRKCEKLAPKYFGPYEIVKRIGAVAYQLKLPLDATLHDVFHVSQLKKYVYEGMPVLAQGPCLLDCYEWTVEPEKILGVRCNVEEKAQESLIQWSEQPASEATWEHINTIKQQFPDAHLEDKVEVQEGGIVRYPTFPLMKTFERKKGKKVLFTLFEVGTREVEDGAVVTGENMGAGEVSNGAEGM